MHSTSITIHSPLGPLTIQALNNHARINFSTDPISNTPSPNSLIQQITEQLNYYFQNPKHLFTLEFKTAGTPFQEKVWQTLREIPSGKTVSYGELAEQLKSSPRAIGNACRANPIPIIIPCHRVTAKNHLGGYTGKTEGALLEIKKWLLNHEA